MIKRFIPLGFLLIALTCSAQKMGELFKTMPQHVLPGFSEADKIMLLVDTALTSIPYPLGNIERINYTDDFLKIKTSSRGNLQIKLLPLINNTKIVCVVKTVCGQACDSQIQFYSTEWNPIESARSGEKGQFGDGKIFITPILETYTVSNGLKEV